MWTLAAFEHVTQNLKGIFVICVICTYSKSNILFNVPFGFWLITPPGWFKTGVNKSKTLFSSVLSFISRRIDFHFMFVEILQKCCDTTPDGIFLNPKLQLTTDVSYQNASLWCLKATEVRHSVAPRCWSHFTLIKPVINSCF